MRSPSMLKVVVAVVWSSAAPRGALAQEMRPPPLPPPPPARAVAEAPAADARPATPPPRDDTRHTLRTGLLIGSAVTQAIAVGLDLTTARGVADRCGRPRGTGEVELPCRAVGGEMLGVGLGALASYVTSFGLAAGFGFVQGSLSRRTGSPARMIRRAHALAWVGGLLVGGGILGAAWSGLATQAACDDANCDPKRALAASLLRGASTLSASVGVGMLSWREGMRRIHTGLALGPGRLGVEVRLVF